MRALIAGTQLKCVNETCEHMAGSLGAAQGRSERLRGSARRRAAFRLDRAGATFILAAKMVGEGFDTCTLVEVIRVDNGRKRPLHNSSRLLEDCKRSLTAGKHGQTFP